jgi:hypothetical protein
MRPILHSPLCHIATVTTLASVLGVPLANAANPRSQSAWIPPPPQASIVVVPDPAAVAPREEDPLRTTVDAILAHHAAHGVDAVVFASGLASNRPKSAPFDRSIQDAAEQLRRLQQKDIGFAVAPGPEELGPGSRRLDRRPEPLDLRHAFWETQIRHSVARQPAARSFESVGGGGSSYLVLQMRDPRINPIAILTFDAVPEMDPENPHGRREGVPDSPGSSTVERARFWLKRLRHGQPALGPPRTPNSARC